MGSELYIYLGSKMSSHIGTYSLFLRSGFLLELEKTFNVPRFSNNLISISRLVPLGFSFNFSDFSFSLSNNLKLLVMVHFFMVFSMFSYKMMLLKFPCMLLLDQKDVL